MNMAQENLKNLVGVILFYVLIGIAINFLKLYSITYYQKVLDAFQYKKSFPQECKLGRSNL